MESAFRLLHTPPKFNRGVVVADIRALVGDELIAADRVVLSRGIDRTKFIKTVVARVNGQSPGADELERRLLSILRTAAPDTVDAGDGGDADRAPSSETGEDCDEPRASSQATRLVALASDFELFHSAAGEAYARFRSCGDWETWSLGKKGFRDFLAGRYFAATGTAANSQALADATNVLRGKAIFGGRELPVFTRVGELGGAVYLDRADDAWRAIEITPGRWRVVADPPIRFKRSRGMLPLPIPVAGGRIDLLRSFINVPDDVAWRLVASWLLTLLFPRGPYAILVLNGEHGSAKSTTERVLRSVVDPNVAALRSLPRDERDLMIAASNNWVLAFDNLSSIPVWVSDALCRIATGGGFATRQLYEDSEEVIFDAQRPIVANGIEELTLRPDLVDRSLPVYLPNLPRGKRRPEAEFWAALERVRPAILGALLDVLAATLEDLPHLRVDDLPRQADFTLRSAAAAAHLGWTAQDFLATYSAARGAAGLLPLEGSLLVEPLRALLDVETMFEGTATELLAALAARVDDGTKRQRAWPKDAARLSGDLRRLAPSLRLIGIEVEFLPGHRAGRRLRITLSTDPEPTPPTDDAGPAEDGAETASPASPASPGPESVHEEASTGDAGDPARDAASSTGDAAEPGDCSRKDAGDAGDAPSAHSSQPELVVEAGRLAALLPDLLAASTLGFDIETTGLDPHSHRIRLAQFATAERVILVDCFKVDQRLLAPIFDGQRALLGHNLGFELKFLLAAGLPVPSGEKLFDTMLAAQLLAAGTPNHFLNKNSLAAVCERFLNLELDKTQQVSDWTGELTEDQIRYAALDAAIVLPLAAKLQHELQTAGLTTTMAIEMRALPAVAWLIHSGAPFDAEQWRALSDAATEEQVLLEREMTSLVGSADLFGEGTVKWSSAAQVLKILQQRGHAIEKTDEATLTPLVAADPLVPLLLKHRDATKRVSAFGIEYLQWVSPATGRIHADFQQLGSDAGRMSCGKPNLQQVPRDKRYRACFKPRDGSLLVIADYSQIELRIVTEVSKDRRLLQAYANGEDIHSLTAKLVTGKAEITPDDRQNAKILNFGLLYGMGAAGLQRAAFDDYGVVLTLAEATTLRERFFAAYAGLRRWQQSQKPGAIETRTLAGRRRRNVERFTWKLNTPIQGTGADGLKVALARLWETRAQCPTAVPVLVVHDEIVVEAPAADAAQAKVWLEDSMRYGMRQFLHQVPVEVEAKVAQDWSAK
jgi:DNA polymerase-1